MSSGYAQWNQYTTYIVNDVVEYAGFIYAATAINVNVVPFPITATWTLIGSGGGGGGTPPLSAVLAVGNTAGGQSITNLVSLAGDALSDLTISSLAGNDVNIEANSDVVYVNAVDINLTATDKVLVSGTNEVELTAPSVKINGIANATTGDVLYYGAGGAITYGAAGGTPMTNYESQNPFTITPVTNPSVAYEGAFCANSGPTIPDKFVGFAPTINEEAYCIYNDGNGNLWVGCKGKVLQFDATTLVLQNTYLVLKGGVDGYVYTLYRDAAGTGFMFAGGDFDTIDASPADNAAYWAGANWNPIIESTTLNNGFNGIVYAFVSGSFAGNSGLFVGGAFTDVGGGGTIGPLNRLTFLQLVGFPNTYSYNTGFSGNFGVDATGPVRALDFGYNVTSTNPCLYVGGEFTNSILNNYVSNTSFLILDGVTSSYIDYNNNGTPAYIDAPVYALKYYTDGGSQFFVYVGTSKTNITAYGDGTMPSYYFIVDTAAPSSVTNGIISPTFTAPDVVYGIDGPNNFAGPGFAVLAGTTYDALNTFIAFTATGVATAGGLYLVSSLTPSGYGVYKATPSNVVQFSVGVPLYYQGNSYTKINLSNRGDTVTLKANNGFSAWYVAGITSGTSFTV